MDHNTIQQSHQQPQQQPDVKTMVESELCSSSSITGTTDSVLIQDDNNDNDAIIVENINRPLLHQRSVSDHVVALRRSVNDNNNNNVYLPSDDPPAILPPSEFVLLPNNNNNSNNDNNEKSTRGGNGTTRTSSHSNLFFKLYPKKNHSHHNLATTTNTKKPIVVSQLALAMEAASATTATTTTTTTTASGTTTPTGASTTTTQQDNNHHLAQQQSQQIHIQQPPLLINRSSSNSSISTHNTTTHSPSTPPKKLWERHYKSFLNRTKGGGGGGLSTTPTTLSSSSNNHPPPLRQSPNQRIDHHHRQSSSNQLDEQNHLGRGVGSGGSAVGGGNTSSNEGAVRGGKFFGHVFSHHKKDSHSSSSSRGGSGTTKTTTSTKQSQKLRKVKSSAELDVTLRHTNSNTTGSNVSGNSCELDSSSRKAHYSPRNIMNEQKRIVQQQQNQNQQQSIPPPILPLAKSLSYSTRSITEPIHRISSSHHHYDDDGINHDESTSQERIRHPQHHHDHSTVDKNHESITLNMIMKSTSTNHTMAPHSMDDTIFTVPNNQGIQQQVLKYRSDPPLFLAPRSKYIIQDNTTLTPTSTPPTPTIPSDEYITRKDRYDNHHHHHHQTTTALQSQLPYNMGLHQKITDSVITEGVPHLLTTPYGNQTITKTLPIDSSSSKTTSSAIKKVFTEFHNSSDTGQDSFSAYLGDEPSSIGQNLFWTQRNQYHQYHQQQQNQQQHQQQEQHWNNQNHTSQRNNHLHKSLNSTMVKSTYNDDTTRSSIEASPILMTSTPNTATVTSMTTGVETTKNDGKNVFTTCGESSSDDYDLFDDFETTTTTTQNDGQGESSYTPYQRSSTNTRSTMSNSVSHGNLVGMMRHSYHHSNSHPYDHRSSPAITKSPTTTTHPNQNSSKSLLPSLLVGSLSHIPPLPSSTTTTGNTTNSQLSSSFGTTPSNITKTASLNNMVRLDSIQRENVLIHKTVRMLRPIQGVEAWQTGRRYLLAPAALAACSPMVISAFWGYPEQQQVQQSHVVDDVNNNTIPHTERKSEQQQENEEVEDNQKNVNTTVQPPKNLAFQSVYEGARPNASFFGSILLGRCLLSYRSLHNQVSGATTVQQWSAAILVLRQNYLLEFDPDHSFFMSSGKENIHGTPQGPATAAAAAAAGLESNSSANIAAHVIPRGYIHLQYAECYANTDFSDALELHFYSSPCAKADKRILLIRIMGGGTTNSTSTPAQPTTTTTEGNESVTPTSDVTFSRQRMVEERENWKICLNKAATLTIEDLYEFPTQVPKQNESTTTTTTKNNDNVDDPSILGRGQYVTVRAARRRHHPNTSCQQKACEEGDRSTTNENSQQPPVWDCALKIFEKNAFWRLVVKERERGDTLVREASVQATLTVKAGTTIDSFLRIRGIFETVDHFVLELELLNGMDLFKYISSRNTLTEYEAARIVHDLLVALHSMNRFGMAHRDIKPANILMCTKQIEPPNETTLPPPPPISSTIANVRNTTTTKGSPAIINVPTSVVKVADFGMATFVGVDGNIRGRCGTPGYVAPEIFHAGLHGGYGNKVDVFSTGVTLYVMLCGYEPFYGETDQELANANKRAVVEFPHDDWHHVSPDAIELIQHLMDPNPDTRYSAKEALKHPWFTKTSVQRTVHNTTASTAGDGGKDNHRIDSGILSELGFSSTSTTRQLPNGEGACVIS